MVSAIRARDLAHIFLLLFTTHLPESDCSLSFRVTIVHLVGWLWLRWRCHIRCIGGRPCHQSCYLTLFVRQLPSTAITRECIWFRQQINNLHSYWSDMSTVKPQNDRYLQSCLGSATDLRIRFRNFNLEIGEFYERMMEVVSSWWLLYDVIICHIQLFTRLFSGFDINVFFAVHVISWSSPHAECSIRKQEMIMFVSITYRTRINEISELNEKKRSKSE